MLDPKLAVLWNNVSATATFFTEIGAYPALHGEGVEAAVYDGYGAGDE